MNLGIKSLERHLKTAQDKLRYVEKELGFLRDREKRCNCEHVPNCGCNVQGTTRVEYVHTDHELYRLQQNLAEIRKVIGCAGQTQAATIQYLELMMKVKREGTRKLTELRRVLEQCIRKL